MNNFDKDEFITECLAAVRSGNGAPAAVKEIVDRAVSNPSTIEAEVGDRTISPMMTVWHRSDELTALHIVWPPDVDLFAHDHNMWAVIGIYGGREDNQFYRRLENGRIEPHTGKTMTQRDVIMLGSDVVHSVANPTREWTAALHVYGGEFFTTPRTMWSKDTYEPMVFDADFVEQTLEAAAATARLADTPGERP
jgi:predicted metal-dependent enzyme (double-stranded beta helix superfamily)